MFLRCRRKKRWWVFTERLLVVGLLMFLWVGQPLAALGDQTEHLGAVGRATYYAKRFAGRITASGEIYDHGKLTAAHTSLPFGTRVRVINLTNDREVLVTVNDRCRPRKSPFIDLSREAARAIGLLGKGSARVRIIPVSTKETLSEQVLVPAGSSNNN